MSDFTDDNAGTVESLEVEVDDEAPQQSRGTVRSINLQAAIRNSANRIKKFIGIDGELLILPAL